jgi:chemotaxis protein CheX
MTLAVENREVAPRESWRPILEDAATEVLAMMAGITVTVPPDQQLPIQGNVTGTVGIAGAISAIFSLRCSLRAATGIASQMLGVSLEEAEAQHCDAVGEICNMVAGNFKVKIGLGDKCMLSLPTVITGRDYQLRTPPGGERLQMQLLDGDERIEIALDIRK